MGMRNSLRSARDTIVNPSGLGQLEFLRITCNSVSSAIRADRSDLDSMRQEIVLMEKASMYIRSKRNRHYFSAVPEGSSREIAITGDRDRIHLLARRKYLSERVEATETHLRRLQKVLSSCEGALHESRLRSRFQRYSDAGLDLSRIIFTREQNDWIDEPYSPNPYYLESLKNKTDHGIPVRSYSEAQLGSFLESLGLPFRCDDLVRIHTEPGAGPGTGPFRENYFADFKIPNLCGGITIHEHLGAFHLEDYPDKSLKRLNDYHNFTIYELPGRQVKHSEITWSFEPDIYDEALLQALIRRILLPE